MARTYYAEGRQLATLFKGLFIILALVLYFYLIPGLSWYFLIGFIFGGVIAAEIIGFVWTQKRRRKKQRARKVTASRKAAPKRTGTNQTHKLTDQQLLSAHVNTLSGTDFERLMEMYYKDQGYSVQRTGGSGDHEVDLILKGKEGYKIAVQCKRWKNDVGNDIVLRLKAGKQVHGCYDAWIVTTSNFTRDAREAAEKLNIKLINGLMLTDKLNRWKKQLRA